MSESQKFAIALFVVGVSSSLIGWYFGAATSLSVCARDGEYTHKLLNATVHCEIKEPK